MKKLILFSFLFWMSPAWGLDSQAVVKCMRDVGVALPAGQYFGTPDNSASVFLFSDSFGGRVGNVMEGALVIGKEGVRVCQMNWRGDVKGFRLPMNGGTRYRYSSKEKPALRALKWTEGRSLNMQKPECPLVDSIQVQEYMKNLVAKAMMRTEEVGRLAPASKSHCLHAIDMTDSAYDEFSRKNAPAPNGTGGPSLLEEAPVIGQ